MKAYATLLIPKNNWQMIFCEPLQQRVLAFHNCLVPHFPPPAVWCRKFQSCIFHPCIFDGADNSSLALSVAPFKNNIFAAYHANVIISMIVSDKFVK